MTEQPQQPADPAEPPAEEQQAVGWLPRPAGALFGAGATAELAYDLLTVDVPADAWIGALTVARDELGCTYFDWLSAVDEPGTGFRICAHLADVAHPGAVRRLIVRTTVPHDAPVLPTAVGVFAGAGWHERETHEMFGVDFAGHPHLVPLLLPDTFEGHPLRKDFVLAARVAKAWPGAKEPGEPAAPGGPKRRQMLPPGVPDPNEWGPLKGQLPPAPARPARGARAAGAAGERPARRTRSVSAGSASQQTAETEAAATEAAAGAPAERPARAARPDRPPRRNRSVSQGSVSQQAAAAEAAAPEPTAAAPEPTASPDTASPDTATKDSAPTDAAAEGTPAARRPAAPPRSADAPWHHARPAFEEAEAAGKPEPAPEPGPAEAPEPTAPPAPEAAPAPDAAPQRSDAPPARRPEDEGGDTP